MKSGCYNRDYDSDIGVLRLMRELVEDEVVMNGKSRRKN